MDSNYIYIITQKKLPGASFFCCFVVKVMPPCTNHMCTCGNKNVSNLHSVVGYLTWIMKYHLLKTVHFSELNSILWLFGLTRTTCWLMETDAHSEGSSTTALSHGAENYSEVDEMPNEKVYQRSLKRSNSLTRLRKKRRAVPEKYKDGITSTKAN